MSLDSLSNRGERLMLLWVIGALLALFGFLVLGIWRVVNRVLFGVTPPRRRKTKRRKKAHAT